MRTRRAWPVKAFILVMLVLAMATTAFAASPIDEPGTKMIECPDCATLGVVLSEEGQAVPCETCGGTGYTQAESRFYNTALSLLPPVVAIGLALITKEVYSSLFIGIVVGGLLFSNFSFEGTINHVFSGGIVAQLSDSYNVGILIFLVILGTLVCLMNKAGGSAAFGRWAKQNIKSRAGAQLASILLGCLIFIDDYFNCLTVGSVMRPITDKHRVSRAKLAYIIDATAAPVCIIAPISSWAAAVSAFAEDGQGLNLFIRAIPYNYYALLTIFMMVTMVLLKVEYGPMARNERNALEKGDLFSGPNPYAMMDEKIDESKGSVLDLVLPVVVLVISCVIGMIYSGGFFSGTDFVTSFSNSDASVGLMLGSAVGLVFALIYYAVRRSMSFSEMMGCIPEGFKAMVPAILILTFAWTLKSMTDSLGAKYFVRDFVYANAEGLQAFLPCIVFRQSDPAHRQVLALLRDTWQRMQNPEPCYEMAVQRNMSRILEYLFCNLDRFPKSEATRIQIKSQIRLQKMLMYIYEHYTETVTLEDIAAAAHISRSEAGRCFHTYMGCSPVDALIQYRLQTARRLLHEKTHTLQEISDACGFNSANYFSRKFKQTYGYAPSQDRGLGK